MSAYKDNTRRIAKNTLMLYFRMFFMMLLGLFTSRIVLESLGETDYGVYNVVGGVVSMFSIISGALATAVGRFITFELGKSDGSRLNLVYSTAVTVQLIIALIVMLLAEPTGLWFIEQRMTIDPARIPAARWVLHFSVLSFVINLMSVPQMALITAHEKMSVYAAIGILDGLLRFGTALTVMWSGCDHLVLYAVLMSLSVLVVRLAYSIYCRRHFSQLRYSPVLERPLLKEMFSFAGWNFIGVTSGVLRDQGGNILINIFFGPVANAARGIALQLNAVVHGFVTNFMTAVNPQITKSYAAGEHEYMFSLMRKASRMSFYLLFVIALPVIFNASDVLALWLKDVPPGAPVFLQLFLVFTLSEAISQPLITSMYATGKIRNYQIIVGGLQMLNLPVSYLCIRLGAPAESTVVVAIVFSQICLAARLYMLHDMIGLRVKEFIIRVYMNVICVAILGLVLPMAASFILPDDNIGFVIKVPVCIASACLSVWFAGCSREERHYILEIVKNKLKGRHE